MEQKKFYEFENMVDTYVECDDIDFELLESLRDIKNEIITNPEECANIIEKYIDKVEDKLIEKDICPICGTHFEYKSLGYNRVPYGSTYVNESEEFEAYCPSCNYVVGE